MSFLRNLFGKKEEPIRSYADFWNWFQQHEASFFKAVSLHKNIETAFFDKISPKLDELKEGFFFLTGMKEEDTAELVLTADGNIKQIVFVEELVAAAPEIPGWEFTALKPPLAIENVGISMNGYEFNKDTLAFYVNEHADFPDEIDITIVHEDVEESEKNLIMDGVYIFLDNYLGELNFLTMIDNLRMESRSNAGGSLISITKLKDFLIWREKEFVEKYEGLRHDTDNDSFLSYEAKLENDRPAIAIMNSTLLNWDSKASHPWIVIVNIAYDGEGNNGMPDENAYGLMDKIEGEICGELQNEEGYLNIGRQTADGQREIYFACNDFRKPSKVFPIIQTAYADLLPVTFEIYKDKYWQILSRYSA